MKNALKKKKKKKKTHLIEVIKLKAEFIYKRETHEYMLKYFFLVQKIKRGPAPIGEGERAQPTELPHWQNTSFKSNVWINYISTSWLL